MTEQEFHARLETLGLHLDPKAFATAFKGAQNLRAEVAKIETYLNPQLENPYPPPVSVADNP